MAENRSDCCKITRINKRDKISYLSNLNLENNELDDSMVLIPAGSFKVGTNSEIGHPDDNEGPAINVQSPAFYMDKTVVTNLQFTRFIEETSYITVAEEIGSSFVFYLLLGDNYVGNPVQYLEWWVDVKGANWKYPFGDERTYKEYLYYPAVHITYRDALAYCKWSNKRLPTEIEWEIAAQGGVSDQTFPWGNELEQGIHNCNIWQGDFPEINTEKDGYLGTSPADTFYENSYGVQQMIGNVWELCSNKARIPLKDIESTSIDRQIEIYNKNEIQEYAAKGGSFLCHSSYCNRYRTAARNGIERISSSSNSSFRCVKDIML